MAAQRFKFPTLVLTRKLFKLRSAKCSLASSDSLPNKELLLQRWERYQQRVQTLLILRPDLAHPIVDGLGRVLDIIDSKGLKQHAAKT